MDFYIVYIIIPLLLFAISPLKRNNLLIFYWAFICILSYDNVSDYYNYYLHFQDVLSGSKNDGLKQDELGFSLLLKLLSFSDYGYVILHSLIYGIVVITYYKISCKYGLVNSAILFFFLFRLVVLHDNIIRQDISICIAYLVFYTILNNDNLNKRHILTILGLIILAFLFHRSAVFLLFLIFVIKYLSKKIIDWKGAILVSLFLVLLFMSEFVINMFTLLSISLSDADSDYILHLSHHLNVLIEDRVNPLKFAYVLFYCFPPIYYQVVNKKAYSHNPHLILCVNLSWIIMVADLCLQQFGTPILTRPFDYLIWFSVMGYSYMLNDMMRNARKMPVLVMFLMFMTVITYKSIKATTTYFGDNNYMTILSDDCRKQKFYSRMIEPGDPRKRLTSAKYYRPVRLKKVTAD